MRPLVLLLLAACGGSGTDSTVPTGPTATGSATTGGECSANHPNWTVGLLRCSPEASPGYTLFAPLASTATYLIDLEGRLVHSWDADAPPGESVYLEPNGHLLRTAEAFLSTPFRGGGAGGKLQEFDWDGNLVWEFTYADDQHLLHHDMERLPSGNIVAIAWEAVTRDEAIALGRDPAKVGAAGLWAVHLIEIDPSTDAIVWEWHVLDHVVQDRDPSAANYGVLADYVDRIDIDRTWSFAFNPDDADWNHVNGVDYNAELDQIALSAHNQDEIWVIDRGTGDIVYRWGSPQNYGMAGPQQLSGQHDVEWIPEGSPGAGNLLIFDNGVSRGWSRVVELETPIQPDGSYARDPGQPFGPVEPVWEHGEGEGFFSSFISGSQRLPNGNTLICEGDNGRFFEVTPDGEIVWEYINPVGPTGPVEQGFSFGNGGLMNAVFRADRYPPDFGAFEGRDLSPKGRIER